MKNLPLGIQTFSKLIKGNYLYVDKTKSIYDLISTGMEYIFLSRPRRFGKSLLISTMAELFSGNKDLFKDLWIYDKIEWTSYPVIHIDFTQLDFESPDRLKESLNLFLEKIALSKGITLDSRRSYKEKFSELIEKLSVKERVVILIDEYDKPIIQFLETGKIETAKENRDVLKSFFGVIKGADPFLRFVFITGVSKFSRVSLFSDLNNLTDITLSQKFATLLGYTEAELLHYFPEYIGNLAEKQQMPVPALLEKIRSWYNGYSWDGINFVYNPFSILHTFNEGKFENYWFSTGTPTFLVQLLKTRKKELMDFENYRTRSYAFDTSDLDKLNIGGLLFQAGYLTIKKITQENDESIYHLTYPNREVWVSFFLHLFGGIIEEDIGGSSQVLDRIREAIIGGEIDRFIRELQSLFASIPYHIFIHEKEAYYHTVIYLILRLSGAEVRCEIPTNTGRIDAVLETGKNIYIMEFKIGTAQEALAQIKTMKYHEPYRTNGKKIILLGVGFDPDNRNVADYLREEIL